MRQTDMTRYNTQYSALFCYLVFGNRINDFIGTIGGISIQTIEVKFLDRLSIRFLGSKSTLTFVEKLFYGEKGFKAPIFSVLVNES